MQTDQEVLGGQRRLASPHGWTMSERFPVRLGVVACQSLSMIIEHRAISAAPDIIPTLDDPVRAVDVLGLVAALFRFSVDEDGARFANITIASKTPEGHWQEVADGGMHGGEWTWPWQPPSGWEGRGLAIFGSIGGYLQADDGQMVMVRALCGFATPAVRSIGIVQGDSARTIPIDSPAGAFVVVVVDAGDVDLQSLGDDGDQIGPVTRMSLS